MIRPDAPPSGIGHNDHALEHALTSWVSPRELADALGVSESSVKRWCDHGRLRVERTVGGHRRITVAEALRFARATNMTIPHPERLGVSGLDADGQPRQVLGDRLEEALLQALTRDDPPAVTRLLFGAFAHGMSLATLFDGPLREVLSTIGEAWREGDGGVVTEHRALDTCLQVVLQLRQALPSPAPGAPVAIGGAPAGDPYLLPSAMAAAVLQECGLAAYNLGPNTPVPVLAAAVERYRAQLVWVSISSEVDASEIGAALAPLRLALRESGVRIVIGGRGLTRHPPGTGQGLEHFCTLAELASYARALTHPVPR